MRRSRRWRHVKRNRRIPVPPEGSGSGIPDHLWGTFPESRLGSQRHLFGAADQSNYIRTLPAVLVSYYIYSEQRRYLPYGLWNLLSIHRAANSLVVRNHTAPRRTREVA